MDPRAEITALPWQQSQRLGCPLHLLTYAAPRLDVAQEARWKATCKSARLTIAISLFIHSLDVCMQMLKRTHAHAKL
jgi:hypothetical protein